MKKLVIIALLFLGVFVNAQETEAEKQARGIELMSKKVDMTVDSELFMSVTQNTYVSESPKAVVMGMYVPENYEAAKKKLKDKKYFVADKILAKHDENYMPPEVSKALEKSNN